MKRPQTLPAFTEPQYQTVHRLLASRVASMMGRKLEEGDWTSVYCAAKAFPNRGWSNLGIDVIHDGLGIEHKMLRPAGDKPVSELFGQRLMHPAATRSIRIADGDPQVVMTSVLEQYRKLLAERRDLVRKSAPGREPDLRTGWLLWQTNLRQFVYFEEETLAPDPADYIAEWHENPQRGARKKTKSLWVYEKETREKRFSITTDAGAKIQPYFNVPPASDPNVYIFTVQGESVEPGLIRVWVPASIERELRFLLGVKELGPKEIGKAVMDSLDNLNADEIRETPPEEARAMLLPAEAYEKLRQALPSAVSDAHLMQLLVARLHRIT